MRVSFAWLKNYVDIHISPEALAEKLTMAGLEVTSLTPTDKDTIMEIEVTPNRADCLSILGVAREAAAITGKKLKIPKISSFRGMSRLGVPIQIHDKSKKQCPRYIGRVIKNVRVAPSPEWLIQRLEAMGIRAVNNIVDITNFCLLELGQPLHAFDLDKLQGPRIIVRSAREGEEILTIDGVKRQLEPGMLVIADKYAPCAIAGIMGAALSEVNEQTSNILLESAYFNPRTIEKTSRKLGLATQSSYRFARGVDPQAVLLGSLRATELIKKMAGKGEKRSKAVVIGRLINRGKKAEAPKKVRLRFARVRETLGTEVSASEIKTILRNLNFSILRKSKDALTVGIPSFRSEISREADLVEEVARLFGYDKIPSNTAQLTPNLSYSGRLTLVSEENYELLRRILSSLGLNEIMTYSLINRQALKKLEFPVAHTIAIKNALSYDHEILRPTLLVGMLGALLSNINRKNTGLKLFELSRVYLKGAASNITEPNNLCIGMAGRGNQSWLHKQGEFCFFDLKGIVEALLGKLGLKDFRFTESGLPVFTRGRCANLLLGKDNLGFLGEVKREILDRFDIASPVYLCELKLPQLLKNIGQQKRFMPLAKFPSVERDISLTVPQEVRSEQIVSLINKNGRGLVAKVTLFDEYFGEQIPAGFRGLAYCLEYHSREKTLTAEEVDMLHLQIRKALAEELKVQFR